MGFGPPMGKLASPRLNAVLRSRSTKVAKSALPLVRPIWGWRRLSLEVILLSGQIGHDMKSLAYGSDFWYVSYLRSRRSSTMLTWGPSSIYPLWGTNFVGFKQGLNNRKTTTYLWWLTPNKVQFFDSGMKIFFSGGKLLQCARRSAEETFQYSASQLICHHLIHITFADSFCNPQMDLFKLENHRIKSLSRNLVKIPWFWLILS